MTTSFHSLNYPSHTFGYVNKHRISQYSVRTNPVLAIPPSSVLLQSDESGNLLNSKKIPGSNTSQNSVCNSLLNQDNIVGIIGGVSIDSTLNFLKKLVRWSTKEGDDCPPFVLCSDPVLRKNEFLNRDGAPMENLRLKRVFLEKSGARCVVMPCHVSHSWHDEVSRGCSVPFLHMGECVARELKEANLRPVERGSPLRIGVLATVATLKAGFYQQKLQNEGFEVVVPDKATMEHTVIPATEAFNRKDMEGARNLLRIALQVLLLRAVNTVILASDDLRELLPHDDPLLKKCVDPLDALARSTIKWTLSAGKDFSSRYFTIKMHHGGQFGGIITQTYIGRSVSSFDYCHPDELSLIELSHMGKELGYGIAKFYQKVRGEFVLIATDQDVMDFGLGFESKRGWSRFK